MNRKSLSLFCLLGALSCAPNNAVPTPTPPQSTPRARITALRGDVKVKLASTAQYVTATFNLALNAHDKILTGRDGHATIEFGNGQLVMLTPESLVAIEQVETFEPANQVARTMDGISVESGSIEVDIDPAKVGSLFRVKTPDGEGIVDMGDMQVVGGG